MTFNNQSTIYGPVLSWRFGKSLGVDPIFTTSTCSFNCIYCQLGNIQNVTTELKKYVETDKVVSDFKNFLGQKIDFDVLTFSGSGEPTLAENLGEMAVEIKKLTPNKPLQILTNATHLHLPQVQKNLQHFDRVIVKLDAIDEEVMQKINRPAKGVTVQSIFQGILDFKKNFTGLLDVQVMFMPINLNEISALAEKLKLIAPETVQLNTPKRPYPLSWHRENRGNHENKFDYEVRSLKTITQDEASMIETSLRTLTGLNVLSVYRE